MPTAWERLSVPGQSRQNPRNESVKLIHVGSQELLGRSDGDFAVLSNQAGRELDISLRRIHLRRVAEAQHAAQALLRNRGTDRARRRAYDRRGLVSERVGAVWPARPIDRV